MSMCRFRSVLNDYVTSRAKSGRVLILLTQKGDTAQQLITLGLVDELFIHLVPVLFGSGTRLFEYAGSEHISLETIEVYDRACQHLINPRSTPCPPHRCMIARTGTLQPICQRRWQARSRLWHSLSWE